MLAEVTGLLMACNTDASALRYVVAVAGRFSTVQSWRPLQNGGRLVPRKKLEDLPARLENLQLGTLR